VSDLDESYRAEIANHIEHLRMAHDLEHGDLAILVDTVYVEDEEPGVQIVYSEDYWELTVYASSIDWISSDRDNHPERFMEFTFEEWGDEDFIEDVYPEVRQFFEEKYGDRVGQLSLPSDPEYSL
jgi:hypothetical protein